MDSRTSDAGCPTRAGAGKSWQQRAEEEYEKKKDERLGWLVGDAPGVEFLVFFKTGASAREDARLKK
jgi:hypothetical protein